MENNIYDYNLWHQLRKISFILQHAAIAIFDLSRVYIRSSYVLYTYHSTLFFLYYIHVNSLHIIILSPPWFQYKQLQYDGTYDDSNVSFL